MFDLVAIQAGLENLFSLQVMAFLLLGFVLGFLVGAVPGFNDANFMAIMLPFTLLLDSTVAIVAMAALYFSAQAAGSIPAILLNVPGTGGTAASTLEGYPMSKQGKSGLALGISLGASTIGALFGATVAIILSPIIGAFALAFGPAELFMVALFGLTVVGSLTGDNLFKGLLAVLLGVMLSFVGADGQTAFLRGTFGVLQFYDGFALIPVILGLFGFAEMLALIRKKSVASTEVNFGAESDVLRGYGIALRQRLNLLRSSVVGVLVGIIPGAGAAIGSFVSYGVARQWSRTPEKFGTGHPEGLIATDASNNAVAAGALVPLVTLGLPGSASTTLMLAALFLHGVQAGPRFFLNHQVEAYTILFSLLVSAVLITVIGLPVARYFKRVAFIPTRLLVPIVFVMLFVGAYAWRFSAFDILVMVGFGLLGMLLRAYRYPLPALLLAFILGPILEAEFLKAVRIGGPELLFSSTICIVMWVACAISLAAPMLLQRRLQQA